MSEKGPNSLPLQAGSMHQEADSIQFHESASQNIQSGSQNKLTKSRISLVGLGSHVQIKNGESTPEIQHLDSTVSVISPIVEPAIDCSKYVIHVDQEPKQTDFLYKRFNSVGKFRKLKPIRKPAKFTCYTRKQVRNIFFFLKPTLFT